MAAVIDSFPHVTPNAYNTLLVVKTFAWEWFRENADRVLFSRRVLIFSITIRLRDVRPLWVEVFGSEEDATSVVAPGED
jgi:hypothetical protein